MSDIHRPAGHAVRTERPRIRRTPKDHEAVVMNISCLSDLCEPSMALAVAVPVLADCIDRYQNKLWCRNQHCQCTGGWEGMNGGIELWQNPMQNTTARASSTTLEPAPCQPCPRRRSNSGRAGRARRSCCRLGPRPCCDRDSFRERVWQRPTTACERAFSEKEHENEMRTFF